MSEELKARVVSAREKLEQSRETCAELAERLTEAISTAFQSWMNERVRDHVLGSGAAVTNTLHQSKIDAMQSDLKTSAESFPTLVQGWTSDKDFWPHREESGLVMNEHAWESDAGERRGPFHFRGVNGMAEKFVKQFMTKHGYQGFTTGNGFEWTQPMREACTRYGVAAAANVRARNDLKAAETAVERDEAAKKWGKK
jgi:hypothetical protein